LGTKIALEIRERFSKRHQEINEKTHDFISSHPEKRAGNEKAIREHIAHKRTRAKNSRSELETLRKFWRDQLSTEMPVAQKV
jgi:hypothetical protein